MTELPRAANPKWNYLPVAGRTSREWSHSGIAVMSTGEVTFAHPNGHDLIFLRESTGEYRCQPVPTREIHGVTSSIIDGEEYLWLADPGVKAKPEDGYEADKADGQVFRLSPLTGELLEFTPRALRSQEQGPWRPTSIVVTGGSDNEPVAVWVADGYGASLVQKYDDAGRVSVTLSGLESGLAFKCPHGIAIDDRHDVPELVVADRGNHRLVFYSLDGVFIRELSDALLASPSGLAIRGNELLVTELDGAILAVDEGDRVRAVVELSKEPKREGWPNASGANGLQRPTLVDGLLNSPHGVAVAPNGDVYITEWVIGGRQIRFTFPAE